MYVAPRPELDDDPLFPIRLAVMAALGFVAPVLLQSPIPATFPTLMIGLLAGMRGAFTPARALGAPTAFAIMLWLSSWLVTALLPRPVFLVIVVGLIFFTGFYIVLKTASPIGMLLAMAPAMMSIAGAGSPVVMSMLRDEMTMACICTALAIPVLYWLLPPRTKRVDVPVYRPADTGKLGSRAAIRAVVLLLLSLWLYTILDSSNLMLAVSANFVLTFPTRDTLWAEASERMLSTSWGAALGLVMLAFISATGHFSLLLLIVALGVLLLGHAMMQGRRPAMVYQYAASVAVSIVGAAIASQEPTYAVLTRVMLTAAGSLAAVGLTWLLEEMFLGPQASAGAGGRIGQEP